MTGNIIGKERIKSAKKLAKVHGVAVLGWNDRPGKEFISFNGDGDKLRGLQEEMEKAGWHAWPVDEGQQGHFMDFGMYPAPADLPTNQDGITPDDATEEPMTIGDDYRYVGPDGLYLYNIVVLTILVSLFLVIREVRAHASTLAMLERIAFCLAIPLILLPFHWVEIHTHEGNLTIRKHFFGRRKVFAFSSIKQARIYSERDSRGYVTKFLGINLKSGRSFDLFLPKNRQEELAAFTKRRIGD
ncbi:MAG: hypothetical protein DME29_10270 [Verrucomicrobia bacterium]|nr:MAG: hypothetical protein DME29_10270 [Verrucomicrobiota bacterium]